LIPLDTVSVDYHVLLARVCSVLNLHMQYFRLTLTPRDYVTHFSPFPAGRTVYLQALSDLREIRAAATTGQRKKPKGQQKPVTVEYDGKAVVMECPSYGLFPAAVLDHVLMTLNLEGMNFHLMHRGQVKTDRVFPGSQCYLQKN
jgi:hypothetical protein